MTEFHKSRELAKLQQSSRRSRALPLRYALFVGGLFFMALGIALTVRSNLGTSPISSVPFVLSLILPFSFGQFTFMMALLFVAGQVLIYGKGFPKSQYFQIAVSPLFGLLIDFAMYITGPIRPSHYLVSILILIGGSFLTAVGIYLQLLPVVIINPTEGIIRALTWKSRLSFGSVKIIFDFSLMALAILISLIFIQSIAGIREGSFVSAFLVGFFVKRITDLGGRMKIAERFGLSNETTETAS